SLLSRPPLDPSAGPLGSPRRGFRAGFRFGRAAVRRFATAVLLLPFFFATRFVVFRFMAVSSSGDTRWPPRTVGARPRASYAIHLRFPTHRSSRTTTAGPSARGRAGRATPLALVRATCRLAASHQPRNTSPGSAPVYAPASNTTAPLTTVAT